MDQIDDLELISEVQSRPILYDPSLQARKEEKDLAWKEIADVLKINFDAARKRWNNLRDSFVKQHRVLQNPKFWTQRKKKRPWLYYQHMTFLIPYRPSSDSIHQGNECDPDLKFKSVKRKGSDSTTIFSRPRRLLSKRLRESTEQMVGPEEVTIDFSLNDGTQGCKTPVMDQTLDGCEMSMRVDNRCICCGSNAVVKEERVMDSDEHFLLSLLPSFKRLSPKNNSKMRMQFQQLLHDIEFGDT